MLLELLDAEAGAVLAEGVLDLMVALGEHAGDLELTDDEVADFALLGQQGDERTQVLLVVLIEGLGTQARLIQVNHERLPNRLVKHELLAQVRILNELPDVTHPALLLRQLHQIDEDDVVAALLLENLPIQQIQFGQDHIRYLQPPLVLYLVGHTVEVQQVVGYLDHQSHWIFHDLHNGHVHTCLLHDLAVAVDGADY